MISIKSIRLLVRDLTTNGVLKQLTMLEAVTSVLFGNIRKCSVIFGTLKGLLT